MADAPALEIGTRYPDHFTDDFEWEAVDIEDAPDLVRLIGYCDGEPTGGSLDWPRTRWHVLFEGKQMLDGPS